MEKRRWLAISVTTMEALLSCLKDQSRVIAIEDPLYPEILKELPNLPGIGHYEILEYVQQGCIILKKTQGRNPFDEENYEIYHFRLDRLSYPKLIPQLQLLDHFSQP